MKYWLLKTNPKNKPFEDWIRPGATAIWETDKKIRGDFAKNDKVAIWQSGSGRYVMATGYVKNRALKDKSNGTHRFEITSTTGVVKSGLDIHALRKLPLFKDAAFLKSGPSGTIYTITNEQGEYLFRQFRMSLRDSRTRQENERIAKAVDKSRSSMARHEQDLAARISRAKKDTSAARKQRLANAPRIPKTRIVSTRVHERNADVIAEVLHRARGTCKCCGQKAPFKRSPDGEPYLEVHHIVPLAADGEDTVENAVALCPNCHRNEHHGKPKLRRK